MSFWRKLKELDDASLPYLIRKAFLNNLIKAGKTGEGSRGGKIIGHTKTGAPIYDTGNGGRKPYPGQDQHLVEPNEVEKRKTFMPPEGVTPHYADSPNLRAYKNLIRIFKQRGEGFQGHITYDPKTDKVETMTPKGASIIQNILKDMQASKPGVA